MPTVIDLFAGCGGMTKGFVDAGFEPVLAVENNHAAAASYANNFGAEHVSWGRVEDLEDKACAADVVIGGPPCQGFSQLGSRDPGDPRNKLWREFMDVVLLAGAKAFVIENVSRFSHSWEFKMLAGEVEEGRLKEYKIEHDTLNAANFGVPQKRLRAFIIGVHKDIIGARKKGDEPWMPTPTHSRSADPLPGLGLRWRTLRDALENIPTKVETTDLPSGSAIEFLGKPVPGLFSGFDLHFGRNPTQLSLERYRHIPPGGNRKNLPIDLMAECWKKHQSGAGDVMGRLEWDQPSVTIRTEFFKPEKGRYLHHEHHSEDLKAPGNRPLTHLEAALIQGFDLETKWCGSKTEIARQIGNAVPPPLARAIAEEVRALLV